MLLLDFQQRPSPVAASEDELRRQDPAFRNPFPKVYADWLGAPFRAHCLNYLSHEFSLQLVNHSLIPGSYQMDAIATVRTRSLRRSPTRRNPRPLRLGKFGCTTALPIGESDRAPVAMFLVKG